MDIQDQNKNFMVTGAVGFIGYHFTKFLRNSISTNSEIHLVDNLSRQKKDDAIDALTANKNVFLHIGDLNDQLFVDKLPRDISTIFHFAALNGTQNFYEKPDEVILSSTLPTLNLLKRYCKENFFETFIYSGSSESYASGVAKDFVKIPTPEDVILSIDDPTNSRWSYSISKTHGEVSTCAFCNKYKKNWQIHRLHNIIGPRMGDKHFIPDFLERLSKNIFELYGWEDTRSFLGIDDAVTAVWRLYNSQKATNRIINIGSDREIKIVDLAKMLMEISNKSGDLKLFDPPIGSVNRRLPDISLLKTIIGEFPITPLEKTLEKMIEEFGLKK